DVELRLAGPPRHEVWPAVLLGAGDWRTDTDLRPPPPPLAIGDALELDDGALAIMVSSSPISSRLVEIRFDRDEPAVWSLLYRVGRPIQYAYVRDALELADVQTGYAARPWAVEMPSAGRPLTLSTLTELRRHGIAVASLTHAAGLSATGDPAIDRALPLPERYEIPAATVAAIERARAHGGRVIAIGTSVVRALEGNARAFGKLVAGGGQTDVLLGPGFARRVVDGVLSGVHEPGSTHHALLGAFATPELLTRAHARALATDLWIHEFGDSTLIAPGLAEALAAAA
ncbi:MAG: S-adenosylmethionine:tRNA ribosyltransferase-isomerase, partial [Deltaproteobacteria bacterium]|nr:S-adenosylmethionine:tRNA ribosyltransferase-isomerase [Nannocystaceae bacterium]